ncbi:uncharacterized protein AMSG_08260, partial [Thecamonas trahens ATCC 50062]
MAEGSMMSNVPPGKSRWHSSKSRVVWSNPLLEQEPAVGGLRRRVTNPNSVPSASGGPTATSSPLQHETSDVVYDMPMKLIFAQVAVVGLILVYLAYRLFFAKSVPMAAVIQEALVDVSLDELAAADGGDGRKAYVAIGLHVYDVTDDPRFGIGVEGFDPLAAHAARTAGKKPDVLDPLELAACWPHLPGRVIDRVLALDSCSDQALADSANVDGLTARQRAAVRHHELRLRYDRRYVGHLAHPDSVEHHDHSYGAD